MQKIKSILEKEFKFLFNEYGFEYDYSVQKEDQEFISMLKNDRMLLRFIIDRADFFVDITMNENTPTPNWREFYKVTENLCNKKILTKDIKPMNKIRSIRSYLKKYLDVILANIDAIN